MQHAGGHRKGVFPPARTDIQRPSSMMSINESDFSRFIVEMSKTRKVYEIFYVGQNHLLNFIYEKFRRKMSQS
jgi:hypothetical protein